MWYGVPGELVFGCDVGLDVIAEVLASSQSVCKPSVLSKVDRAM